MVRYLSNEWIAAVAVEIAADAALRDAAASHTLSVTQVVTDSPFGEVVYHLSCANGVVAFAAGRVPSDITFTQTYDTAVAIAQGRLNAAEAFINGQVRFSGDHQRVIDAQPFFALLDGVFARVRAHTTF